MVVEVRGDSCDSRKGDIVKVVVDLVGEDQKIVFQAEVANALELRLCEDFSYGVVTAARWLACWISEV